MLKIQLIPDAKRVITATSTLCMSAVVAILGTWFVLPDTLKATITPGELHAGVMCILGLGIVGRFLKAIETNAPQEDLVPSLPVQGIAAIPSVMTEMIEKPVAVVTQSVPVDSTTAPADPATKEIPK